MLEGIENGEISENARTRVTEILKRSFRPEFLNRLDEIIFFTPLTKENVRAIVDICLASLTSRLEEQRIKIEVTDAAKDFIIDASYDPIYGARPMKRYIQSTVETLVARKIIGENLPPDTTLKVDLTDNGLEAVIKDN